MTLGQFALAAGAAPRWVLNARAALRLLGPYDEGGARQLGLAKALAATIQMPLERAYNIAGIALSLWPRARLWSCENLDGSVRLVVDLERYLSVFATRLSLAYTRQTERKRGPRRRRSRNAMATAQAYGVDLGLVQENLALTPAERLRRLDEAAEFFTTARVIG